MSDVVGPLAAESHKQLIKSKIRLTQGKNADDPNTIQKALKTHKAHVGGVANLIKDVEKLERDAKK